MQTIPATPSLAHTLDRLAHMEAMPFPLVSLYLNAQPDSRGKDNYAAFVRKELRARVRDFELRSAERESFERDVDRIERWLAGEVRPSANGIAIFACSAANYFEVLQLDAPIERHRLTLGDRPHLYPLARLLDRHPRHAVVVADTNQARIYVFGRGRTIDREELTSPKMSRHDMGGWSQLRYQRHVENLHLHHAKDLVEALARIVAEDRAERVFLCGDEVIVPLLRSHLTKNLAQKVVGVLRLEIRTPEQEVMDTARVALAAHEAKEEAERVQRLRGEWRSGGLAVAGRRAVREALANGQIDELSISTALVESNPIAAGGGERTAQSMPFPDELVHHALVIGAKVRFVEDTQRLADMGGVAATLRYRPGATPRNNSPVERKVEA